MLCYQSEYIHINALQAFYNKAVYLLLTLVDFPLVNFRFFDMVK